MKAIKRSILIALCALLVSCSKGTAVDLENIAFVREDIVLNDFGGLGVEWGAYEDTDKLLENGWEIVLKHMDKFAPARARIMLSYDWFVQNFDNKGNDDKNDDTWSYNYTNKYAKSMFDCLDYCQTHNVDVAIGAWNVVANMADSGKDWGMTDEVTSDIRWAKISQDFMDLLINKKGYTCIKWFVNTNEPNWLGAKGSSKNYNNTYEKWEQGVKNVRKALDDINCQHIGIIGGDTTGKDGTEEYFTNIAKNIPELVGDYGCHLYVSRRDIDLGRLYTTIDSIYSQIRKLDKGMGTIRPVEIWEAGILDGKTALDSQALIDTTAYALGMFDYTIQCLAAGINGICYWDFDDAMHFMYLENTTVEKRWGMFSSLADSTSHYQELRPWYHSSMLLTHLFKKGNYIISPKQNNPELIETFRSLATISKDKKQAGYALINSGREDVKRTFVLDEKVEGDTLYIYNFADSTYRLDSDGYIIPNAIIPGSLNKTLTFDVPKSSAVIVSNTRL